MDELKKYQDLYKRSEYLGSARILREYLNLEQDLPIPLTISHGVDMGHCSTAMEVMFHEPIHWAYNEDIYQRATPVKPAIRLPHPWLLLKAGRPAKTGTGTLVIGPPPGRKNDESLLKCLQEAGIESYDLMMKYRGSVDESQKFWIDHGVHVVTAGVVDNYFYDRLFDLLNNYEYIVGCTNSSALYFASAIGKKCKIIDNYFVNFYDILEYRNFVNFSAPTPGRFLRLLRQEHYAEASRLTENLLGAALFDPAAEMKERLISAIAALNEPCHFGYECHPVLRKAVIHLAMRLGKPSLISHGIGDYFKRRMQPRICVIKMKDIDIWINGLNENNFIIKEVEYKKGVTEPGRSCD